MAVTRPETGPETEPGGWTLKALYADWEYACCGTPFRVGDEVRWELALSTRTAAEPALWDGQLSELHPRWLPALRRVAVLRAETSPPRGARLHGLPAVTNHHADAEETERITARVRAIEVVSTVTRDWIKTSGDPASYRALPGQPLLGPVDDSEARPTAWRVVPPPAPRGRATARRAAPPPDACEAERGFLVTLEPRD